MADAVHRDLEVRLIAVEFVVARLLALTFADTSDEEFAEVARSFRPPTHPGDPRGALNDLEAAIDQLFTSAYYVKRRIGGRLKEGSEAVSPSPDPLNLKATSAGDE